MAKKQKPKLKPPARKRVTIDTPAPVTPAANLLRDLRIADDLAGGKGLLDLSGRLRMYIGAAIKALEGAENAATSDASPGIQGWLAGRWMPPYGDQPRRWVPMGKAVHVTREDANGEAWQIMIETFPTSRSRARDAFAETEAKFIKVIEQ